MNSPKARRKISPNQGKYCLEVPQPKQSTGVALRARQHAVKDPAQQHTAHRK